MESSGGGLENVLARRVAQLQMIVQLTASLSETNDLEQIYHRALDAIEVAIGADRAAVLTFDAAQVMRFRASRGLSERYIAAAEGHSPWSADAANPLPVTVRDVLEDPSLAALRETIVGEGIRALGFIPLVASGRLVGKFMTYFDQPHEFTDEEIALSVAIARHVALGVERARGEEALRNSHEQLELILDGVADGITAQDVSGKLVFANRAAAEMIGSGTDDLLARAGDDVAGGFEMFDESGAPLSVDDLPGRQATNGESPPSKLLRFRSRGADEDRWAIVKSTPAFAADGSVRYAINIFRDITERRKTEEDLERSNALLSGVIDASPLAVMLLTGDGRLLLWNRAAEHIFGWRREEIVGSRLPTVPEDEMEEFLAYLRQVESGSDARGIEARRRRKDGTIIDVAIWTARLPATAKHQSQIVSIVADITERRRAEKATQVLAEASEQLSASLDYETTLTRVAQLAVPGIADWCTVDVLEPGGSLRRLALAHRDPQMIRWATELRRRYPPDPGTSVVHEVLRSGSSKLFETITDEMLRNAARDSEHLDLLRTAGFSSAIIVPLIARGSRLGAISMVLSDSKRVFTQADLRFVENLAHRAAISIDNALLFRREQEARTEAEAAALRLTLLQSITASLARAGSLQQIASIAIGEGLAALGGTAGSFAVWSESERCLELAHTSGFSEDAARRWRTVPPDEDHPLNDCIREKRILLFPDGHTFFDRYPTLRGRMAVEGEALAAIPLQLHGEILGAIGIRFPSVREFGEHDREFMSAVAQQCAQALERARLYEAAQSAREEAEEANRTKDEFLATLSHELRTPMTATLGWSRMLALGTSDPQTLKLGIDSIHRSTLAQSRIIDDLLDVSRIITGKMRLEMAPTELGPIIISALEAVRTAAEARSIHVDLDLQEFSGVVSGDEDRLRQVIWNLLSNAIKFTPKGGTVTVRLDGTEASARIRVTDSGKGIAPDLLPHVFERFRQGDSSSSRSDGRARSRPLDRPASGRAPWRRGARNE